MPVARLRGVVEEKGDDWAIIGVGGIGMLASVPATTADALVPGEQAALFTYLHVREDALTLFGFSTRALGLLSALDYGQLTSAIAAGHADVLRRVPGIGQKTAERLVLELRDKVTPPAAGVEVRPPDARAAKADAEIVAALMGLGYSQAEASAAAERLPQDGELPLEQRIRMALQFFAKA
jgi:Holliday junction DNA helicase RuvA